MPDKEAVIIEASVLLITLMFVILSVWATRAPESMPPAQVQFLDQFTPFSFAVGFVLAVAALLAALRMFGAPEVFETLELVFFSVGLSLLGAMFFLNALTKFWNLFVFLAVASAALVLWALWQGIVSWRRRRHVKILTG